MNSHDWKPKKISGPTKCFSCRKPIWTPFAATVRCTTCQLFGHLDCASKTTVRCTKMPTQSFMALGVAKIKVLCGINMDPSADLLCTLQLDQQTATTRVSFRGSTWDQTFTFVVTSLSKKKLVIECYELEYMGQAFLGTAIIPNLAEYAQPEELLIDLQRGGVKTKMTLKISIEYHKIYPHDVEWHFEANSTSQSIPNNQGQLINNQFNASTPIQSSKKRLKRRHSSSNLDNNSESIIDQSKVLSLKLSSSVSAQDVPIDSLKTATQNQTPDPKPIAIGNTSKTLPNSENHAEDDLSGQKETVGQAIIKVLKLREASNPNPMPSTSESNKIENDKESEYDSDDYDDDNSSDDQEGEFVSFRDHFGFPIEPEFVEAYLATFEFLFTSRMKQQAEYFASNLNKFLSYNPSRPIISNELVGFAKAGIPLSLRGDLWQATSGSRDAMKRHPGLYEKLLNDNENASTDATAQIEKDLRRTFISNPFLSSAQDICRLRRVLRAFSFYDRATGYCQSLNFIVALFLLLMNEEEAFWLLVVVVKKYLPDYYSNDMAGSKTDAHIFEAMLYTYFPLIAHQLFDLGLPVVLRTASWFLCMFVTILPIETTMRIFDWMFVEGSHIIFSVGLALFDLHAPQLLSSNSFDTAYFTFTSMTSHCFNADHLIHLASTKYRLLRKEIANLRRNLRIEFSRRDERELLNSLSLSPEDFYLLVRHIQGPLQDGEEHPLLEKNQFCTVFSNIFPDMPKTIAESVFGALDSDEDQALTVKECLLGISAFFQGDPSKKAEMWFRVFDRNNDGVLDTTEIKDLLSLVWKLIDKKLDHSWIDEFLQMVETTHRGKMTKKEFVGACLEMPVLSEWLKFGLSLGDRVKVLAAKEETEKLVANEEENISHPHDWIDEEGKIYPKVVEGTVSPTGAFSDDDNNDVLQESDFMWL